MKSTLDLTRAASIRKRIALAVVCTVGVYLGVDQVLRTIQFKASFDALDARTARQAIDDARDAIERRAERLGAAADMIAAGLPPGPDICDPIDADIAFIVARDGYVEASHVSDAVPEGRARRLFPGERWSETHPILDAHDVEAASGGLVGLTFTGDIGLYAARTFASRDGVEMVAIVADLVDDEVLSELASRSGRTAHVQADGGVFAAGTGDLDRTGEVITARGALLDSLGRSLGTITVDVPNEVADFRANVERFEILTAVGAALLFPLALLVLLQIVVTGPLQRLTRTVVEIGESDDTSRSVETDRADEIGTLANAFDDMLRKLDASRRASLRVARLSGRADVAIDVAHNAGNAVNSVAVAAQLARQRARELSTADLVAIVDALKGARHDLQRYVDEDPRGQHLLPFLESTVEHLAGQFRALDEDCAHLEQHTEKVVGMLGRLTDVAPGRERGEDEVVDIGVIAREVLVDAIGRARADVDVDVPPADAPEAIVSCDPERLRDMLDALAQNAIEAVAGASAPLIRLRAETDGEQVRLTMADNGHGIPAELADTIFEQGVTTRADRPGLGLHLAAVTAHEMGGGLAVTSDGPGTGTTAVVDLPVASDRRRQVAGAGGATGGADSSAAAEETAEA